MSRQFKTSRDFVPSELYESNSPQFLDVVAKFGPLIIAIIAVAFCFYIYKKVVEMDKSPNTILQTFMQDQTHTNFQIQESYNAMVEQFNNLSGTVHNSLVKNGTIETQLSPSPSIINETLVEQVKEEVEETNNTENNTFIPVTPDVVDDVSEVSVTTGTPKSKRGRKPKNTVNF